MDDVFDPRCHLKIAFENGTPVFVLEFEDEETARRVKGRIRDDLKDALAEIADNITEAIEFARDFTMYLIVMTAKILERAEITQEGNKVIVKLT